MVDSEKTFEQGVVVGMLLNKAGSKTYNLKDQLFKYILENGKIIATCKFGNNLVKVYVGVIHYSDPNYSLFWKLNSRFRDGTLYANGYIGENSLYKFGSLAIFPEIAIKEGIIMYRSHIFFSENDEPLFGDVKCVCNYSSASFHGSYTDSGEMLGMWYWPSYLYIDLEESINNIDYFGDFECYAYVDIKTYSNGVEEAVKSFKYRDNSGEDYKNSSGRIYATYKKCHIDYKWHTKTVIDDDGNSLTKEDYSKPPILTKGSIESFNLSPDYLSFYIFPTPMMTADNITESDITKALTSAYDVMFKNAEGPGGDRMTGAKSGILLKIEE